ncbi:rho GTPase-activating protein 26 [Cydia amplana]|uniref:rho GTPase-activating protein 26 n=1 Tax=Cydia amplana TaxID=1869771 RepID=UPI002FE6AB5F
MGVGLVPLEFTECLADSPHFRENLLRHEKELDRTSQQVKRLIKEVKDVVHAAKRLGAAQLALAGSMENFEFACIGASMTEDERVISHSLHHFAKLMRTIEDERERMLGRAHEQIIAPLERFRKEHIGAVKEGKKKFDKKTAKFCQSQERTLSLSTKKQDNVFQEADAAMDMAERDFCQASLEYVFQLQAVREREKFELVETLLGFVFSWWTFHHTAHDVHHDAEPLVRDLQLRIQRTRTNFEETSKQTESLMKKMMEVRQMNKEVEAEEPGEAAEAAAGAGGGVSRAGYLYLMEKKAFGTAWSKHYCTYEKHSRTLRLLPYSQINPKTTAPAESVCVCGARRAADTERRFCWDALPADRERPPLTLQALSERDRTAWLRALSPQVWDTPPHGAALLLGRAAGRPRAAAAHAASSVRARPDRVAAGAQSTGMGYTPTRSGASAGTRCRPTASGRRSRCKLCPSETGPRGCGRSVHRYGIHPHTERRFCWDALPADRERPPLTLQALSERDRTAWLRALSPQSGAAELGLGAARGAGAEAGAHAQLDDAGFAFVRRLVQALEERGLEEQGLYRVAGVASKVSRLVSCAGTGRAPAALADPLEWESKTLTSALKSYLRALPEPLATHALHERFLAAAKLESRPERVAAVAALVAQLPLRNRDMLRLVVDHLRRVAARSERNLMTASNLAVCFGPTLLRAPRESVAAILDLKFYNVLVETLLDHADLIFAQSPQGPNVQQATPAQNGLRASPAPLSSALLRAADCAARDRAAAPRSRCRAAAPPPLPPARWPPPCPRRPWPPPPPRRSTRASTRTPTGEHRPHPAKRVRTLYACLGESEGELSFEPNQIITNVSASAEPGWLRGTLNGKSGLVPENYVEPLP